MFRRGAARLLSHRRNFSTSEAPNEPAVDDPFTAAWRRIVPNLDPPKTPLAFKQPPPPPSTASKLTINLVSKYSSSCFSNKQADMAIVPAVTGQMRILPGHVSSISELKPGLLSIHEDNEVTKLFVSSGFAFVHSNSVADIIAVEAVPIEHFDPDSVQKALAEFTQKLDTVSTDDDMEKVEAQIAVDVLSTLKFSLSG